MRRESSKLLTDYIRPSPGRRPNSRFNNSAGELNLAPNGDITRNAAFFFSLNRHSENSLNRS